MKARNPFCLGTDAGYISHFYIGNEIRIKYIEKDPWIVLKDVCDVLKFSSPSRMTKFLEGELIYKAQCVTRAGIRYVIIIPLYEVESFLHRVLRTRNVGESIHNRKREQIAEFLAWISGELIPYVEQYKGGNK